MKKPKSFVKHNMYKGDKVVVAKTFAEHLSLKKKGYGHKRPQQKG